MTQRLDSRSLELFVALARTLNFRRAAAALHLSQPPLSRAIRALEGRLGTTLFQRDKRSVSLTPAGAALLPRAERILGLIAEAEAAFMGAAPAARLHVGLTTAVELTSLEPWLDRLEAARPGVERVTRADSSPRLVAAVRSGRLDAALVALPVDPRGLAIVPLTRQPLVVALASGHPLAARRTLRLGDLDGQALFRFERARQPAFFDYLAEALDRAAVTFRAVPEPPDHARLLAEVAAGRALALLPASFRSMRRAGVACRALREGPTLAVGIGLAVGPAGADLAAACRDAAAGPPSGSKDFSVA